MPEQVDAVARGLARRLVKLVEAKAAEADTSIWVRDVLCDLCGWPKAKLGAQKNAPRGPVDWHAPLARDAIVHIEVKRVGRQLEPEMIIKYLRADATAARHVFGILTNGISWEVWLGGRWFADRNATPVLLRAKHLRIGQGRTAISDSAKSLVNLPDMLARKGARQRWLAEVGESEEVLKTAAQSQRTLRSWAKSYASRFTGTVPLASILRAERDEDGREAPTAVAAALAMRSWAVAKVTLGELGRLTGDRRFAQSKGRVRAMQEALAERFPLLGER